MDESRDVGARSALVLSAVVLSLASVLIELWGHLCAAVFFDPLPNAAAVLAYLSLPVIMLVNRWVLATAAEGAAPTFRDAHGRFRPRTDQRWRIALAALLSGTGIAIAGIYTLLFLPVMPVGMIAVIIYGLGLCAFSPPLNLVVLVMQFRALARRWGILNGGRSIRLLVASGMTALVPLLVLVGHPVAIGYFYQRAVTTTPRETSLRWLRRLGGEATVLDLCYRRRTPLWVSWGRQLAGGSEPEVGVMFRTDLNREQNDLLQARRVYFLLTGRPYETAAAPRKLFERRSWSDWDPVSEELGGELVGHAVAGLSLASSRIDGVLDPATETAYCEWTMEFENSSAEPAEARAEILLPEGGVVDKVSLWIDGEERRAAFGGRSVVREAYQEVAVVERRDPLLVTMTRPDRVLAQCFPVPANGRMKIRLGMSSPLVREGASGTQLCYGPPGFQQVNFKLPDSLKHEVWLEGRWRAGPWSLLGDGWRFSGSKVDRKVLQTARRSLGAAEILRPPVVHLAGGGTAAKGDRPAPEFIRAGSYGSRLPRALDVFVVVDTSRSMADALGGDAWRQLADTLRELPRGSRVRLVDGRQLASGLKPEATPWIEASRASSLQSWWKARRFDGSAEPAHALGWALNRALETRNPAVVLWLHGPVPADVADATSLLQLYERRPDGPALVAVQLRPGPDALLDGLAGSRRVFAVADRAGEEMVAKAVRLAWSTAVPEAISGRVPLGGREPAINGLYIANQSFRNHPASRLAAQSAVLSTWYTQSATSKAVQASQKLAVKRRLVTPLSGAVVLETQEQYARHNLSDAADDASIPSVPEPGTLALLATAGALGAASRIRRRRSAQAKEATQ